MRKKIVIRRRKAAVPPPNLRHSTRSGRQYGFLVAGVLLLLGGMLGFSCRSTPQAATRPAASPPAAPSPPPVARTGFVHPGIALTRADLDAIKANLGKEPWQSGFAALAADRHSQLAYRMRGPCETVSRAPHLNRGQWMDDMTAVYYLALRWYFTGDEAYAQKGHDILLAWAAKHTAFDGRERNLDLGDYARTFAGGADILRGTWPGWTAADTETVKRYFDKVYWPTEIDQFDIIGPANKGTLALVAAGAIAVFNDDRAKLDRVIHLFRTQPATGLANTLPIGQIAESGRDQGHAYGTIVSMAFLAEILWKQGIDVYAELDDRLLAIGEYFGRNNYKVPTPYVPFSTIDAQYNVEAGDATGKTNWPHGRCGLNILHGAYVLRRGLQAPYLELQRRALPQEGDSFLYEKPADASTATPLPPVAIPALTAATGGLSDLDLGTASPAGGSSYSGGLWTVRGGGADIWGPGPDSCHFAYARVTGDCTILAKVETVAETNASAKAGLMWRESLAPEAPSAYVALMPARKFEVCMSGWTPGALWGGTNREKYVRDLPAGYNSYWLKIERRGSLITAFTSPDGASWGTTVVAQYNSLGDTAYLGLVVCSHENGTLNTATFSNVHFTGANGGSPVASPPTPLALLASPGNGCVPLRWTGAFGASGYRVKRATAQDGPYATLATVAGNRYTDTRVDNGSTYYYVVSALNTAGESGNSPCDTVTPRPALANASVGSVAPNPVNRHP